jgi:hypothetical protein
MVVVMSACASPPIGLGVVLALLLRCSFGRSCLDQPEVPAMLVVEASRRSAGLPRAVVDELAAGPGFSGQRRVLALSWRGWAGKAALAVGGLLVGGCWSGS